MNLKSEKLIDLIFNKLKNYKGKDISLEKENFKKFIFLLLKDNWIELNWIELNRKYLITGIIKGCTDIIMYNLSSLTIVLIVTFILSLYFLFKVTSN